MKKIILLILVTAFTVIACKKNETTTPSDNTPYFQMKINGVDYKDDGNAEGLYVLNTSSNIVSYSQDGKSSITLFFEANEKGIYTVGVNNTNGSYDIFGPNSSDTTYISDSGIFNITEYDTLNHKVSGTFNMVVRNWSNNKILNITEGKFNKLPLTEF